MVSEKQLHFREEFRESIPEGYSGVRHGFTALAIGIVAFVAFAFFLSEPIRWYDWLVVPLTMLGWNVVEWIVHTQVLHRPRKNKIARALYVRHTLTHHQFFTHELSELESARDLSIVFFPVFALPTVLIMTVPAAGIAWLLFSWNAGLLVMMSVTAMYVLFEVMHLGAHVPDNAFVRYFPLLNTMRRHHIAHHNHRLMMEKNMNFTFPFMDWLMGTSDVKRGLLGTTFNGYSTRFVEAEPSTIRTKRTQG